MKKVMVIVLFLVIVTLVGCDKAIESNVNCVSPAVLMTDVNGNQVCVKPNEVIAKPDTQKASTISSGAEDNRTAEEVIKEMRETANLPVTGNVVAEPKDDKETAAKPAESTPVPKKIVVEGDFVSFPNLKAVDPEGDSLRYTFSNPLNDKGEWQTKVGDAGEYLTTIVVTDGSNSALQQVLIVVQHKNLPPVISSLADIVVAEGETVNVKAIISDPEGDKLMITYTEPLSADGEWKTAEGDAGEYKIDVTASDGEFSDFESFVITVRAMNRPPVMEDMADITVSEGDTVSFEPRAADPEGSTVTFTYSGWMTKNSYMTTFSDSGLHLVTITASDGVNTAVQEVLVTVTDVNRAPYFVDDSWK